MTEPRIATPDPREQIARRGLALGVEHDREVICCSRNTGIRAGHGRKTTWAASGTALGVDPQAQADRDGAARVLAVGADIFIGDMVRTGPHGNVQIKFDDDTKLVVARTRRC